MSAAALPAQKSPRSAAQNAWVEADASCRVPLLSLFAHAVFWLVVSAVFGLLASVKLHAPHFLSSVSWLTYGRVHVVQTCAFLYGFGVQAAIGAGIWLLCRLGRTTLSSPAVAFVGSMFWNLGVTVGVLGILCGDSTGYDSFEMPRYSAVLLLPAFLLCAVCAILTFHRRQEDPLYPSQWFVLGSLFWFPWIFTTAAMLLLFKPVRGVMQASVDWWYANNLSYIALGFSGLALIFYFIPKITGRSLHSVYLAMISFIGLAVFGSWGGVPFGAPVPAWMGSLSLVGTVLTTVPVLAVIVNMYHTTRNDIHSLDRDVTLRFTYVALVFWFIANFQRIIGVLPGVAKLTAFTWYSTAQWEMFHWGFLVFAFSGAIYHIIPRMVGGDANLPIWNPTFVKWHFNLMLVAVLVSFLSLMVAGIGQGYLMTNPDYSFVQVMAGTLMPFRLAILGDLLLVAASGILLLNMVQLVAGNACRCWQNFCKGAA